MLINNFVEAIKQHNPNFIPKVILDVGSRDLEQAIEFSKIWPDARIIAFEPDPRNYLTCLEKANQCYPAKIEVHRFAISTIESNVPFYSVSPNVGAGSLLKPIDIPFGHNEWNETVVRTVRLDTFLRDWNIDKVDIIWADTQGTELDVLKSMKTYINRVSYIHCEAAKLPYYEKHILYHELNSFLEFEGFKTTFHLAAGHPYQEGDIIAIRV